MNNRSLFQPAHKRQRHLKVLLRGTSSTGKTRAALGFPGPVAVIDLENSTAQYEGFDYLQTRDIRELERALTELGGGRYQTVVVDSLTVYWQLLQQAGQALVDKRKPGNDSLETGDALSRREWGIIKRWYAAFLTRLINLPLHVVLIARETDLYEEISATQLKRIGTKADVEKNTTYNVDLELLLSAPRTGSRATYQATVEKTRLDALALGTVLTGYGPGPADGLYARHLAPVAAALSANTAAPALDDETAAAAPNAQALAESETPAPNERVALRRRMMAALSRPALRLHADEDKAKVVQAITDGQKTDALDLAGLQALVERCEALRTEEDLLRFWAQYDQAQAAKRAQEATP